MTVIIRLATPDDAPGVQAIYAPIVRETAIPFELESPSVEEMRQRIAETLMQRPRLVCEHPGDILGYVYASQHRSRAAYQRGLRIFTQFL
jgi:phosphinothricin acetyltransferase